MKVGTQLYYSSKTNNWASYMYSLPYETNFNIGIHDLNQTTENCEIKFHIAPFIAQGNHPHIIIQPQYLNENAIAYIEKANSTNSPWEIPFIDLNEISKQEYEKVFEKMHTKLAYGKIKKIVLTTVFKKILPETFSIDNLLIKLREKFPQSFVYFVTTPYTGTWIGASPEVLLEQENEEIKTMSLAGTISKNKNETFESKEIEEQQIVTDYIANILNTDILENIEISPLEHFSYGDLIHLKTTFKGKISPLFDFDLLIQKLHPTPAISGFPTAKSIELIKELETHLRTYYTGYIGVESNKNKKMFVNLRCLTVKDNAAYMFVGGGLTKDSILEKEWNEVKRKASSILDLI